MITLFRRLREKFIGEGNVRRYLLYAIGEVALVMIGILLALQVNNWNEQRKAETEEQEILMSLYEDLEFAIAESKDMISRDSLDVVIMRDFLLGNDLSKYADRPETIDSLVTVAIWGVGQSTPVIQTYNDIKSTGKTVLIQNEEIRNRLTLIEFRSNAIRSSLDDKLIVQQFQVDEIVAKHFDMVTYMEKLETNNTKLSQENDYDTVLSSKEFRNTIASKQRLSRGLYEERVAFNELLEELAGLIRNELDQ